MKSQFFNCFIASVLLVEAMAFIANRMTLHGPRAVVVAFLATFVAVLIGTKERK